MKEVKISILGREIQGKLLNSRFRKGCEYVEMDIAFPSYAIDEVHNHDKTYYAPVVYKDTITVRIVLPIDDKLVDDILS